MQISERFNSWSTLIRVESGEPKTYLGLLTKELILLILEKLKFDFLNFRATSLANRDIVDNTKLMKFIRIEYMAIESIVRAAFQGKPIQAFLAFLDAYSELIVHMFSPHKLIISTIFQCPLNVHLHPFYSEASRRRLNASKDNPLAGTLQSYMEHLKEKVTQIGDSQKAKDWLIEQLLQMQGEPVETTLIYMRINFWLALVKTNPQLAFLVFQDLFKEKNYLFCSFVFECLGSIAYHLFEVDWKESIKLVKGASEDWKTANSKKFRSCFLEGMQRTMQSEFPKIRKDELLELGIEMIELPKKNLGQLISILVFCGAHEKALEIVDKMFEDCFKELKPLKELRIRKSNPPIYSPNMRTLLKNFTTYAVYRPKSAEQFFSIIRKKKIDIKEDSYNEKFKVGQCSDALTVLRRLSRLQTNAVKEQASAFEGILLSDVTGSDTVKTMLTSISIATLKPEYILELVNGFQSLTDPHVLNYIFPLIAACPTPPLQLFNKLERIVSSEKNLTLKGKPGLNGDPNYLFPKIVAAIALIDLDKALEIFSAPTFGYESLKKADCYLEIAEQLHKYKTGSTGAQKILELLILEFNDQCFRKKYLVHRLWFFLKDYNETLASIFLEKYTIYVYQLENNEKINGLLSITGFSKELIHKIKG